IVPAERPELVPPEVRAQPRAPVVAGSPASTVMPPPPRPAQPPPPAADAVGRQSGADRLIRREIHRQLLDFLDLAKLEASKLDDPSMRPKVLTALRRIIQNLGERIPANVNRDLLLGELADEALGLGPLERFLADPTVSEIMVVDASTIYIERGG